MPYDKELADELLEVYDYFRSSVSDSYTYAVAVNRVTTLVMAYAIARRKGRE